jgi:hypothetical protein
MKDHADVKSLLQIVGKTAFTYILICTGVKGLSLLIYANRPEMLFSLVYEYK